MSLKLPKLFLHRKFKYNTVQESKNLHNNLYEMFLLFNKVDSNKDITELIQFAKSINLNKHEFSKLLHKNGYTIYNEEWNVYDSIDLFFKKVFALGYYDYDYVICLHLFRQRIQSYSELK